MEMPAVEKVTPMSGEPFRFMVKSDRTDEIYVCDIQCNDFQGECRCIHFLTRLAPRIALGARGPNYRCKHLKRSREAFLEMVLPKLAKAMNMEDTEPEKEPSTEYGKARLEFLKKHPRCAVYPDREATDCHHQRGRLSKLLMDQRYWIPVCREGHQKIHDNPAWARTQLWHSIPLLCAKGEWNKQP